MGSFRWVGMPRKTPRDTTRTSSYRCISSHFWGLLTAPHTRKHTMSEELSSFEPPHWLLGGSARFLGVVVALSCSVAPAAPLKMVFPKKGSFFTRVTEQNLLAMLDPHVRGFWSLNLNPVDPFPAIPGPQAGEAGEGPISGSAGRGGVGLGWFGGSLVCPFQGYSVVQWHPFFPSFFSGWPTKNGGFPFFSLLGSPNK